MKTEDTIVKNIIICVIFAVCVASYIMIFLNICITDKILKKLEVIEMRGFFPKKEEEVLIENKLENKLEDAL